MLQINGKRSELYYSQGDQVDDESSFNLFENSNITRKTIGAKVFKGHDWDSPAYRFIRFDHIPPVSSPVLQQLLRQIQNNNGFVFVASIRQDRSSRGTLVGLEGSDGHRQFEIISNGHANSLDLVYWKEGSQNVISFEDVDISDSQWKNITLHVHGENANLYVDCSLIDSFTLDESFYHHLEAKGSRMYVAKGSNRESHFRVRAFLPFSDSVFLQHFFVCLMTSNEDPLSLVCYFLLVYLVHSFTHSQSFIVALKSFSF